MSDLTEAITRFIALRNQMEADRIGRDLRTRERFTKAQFSAEVGISVDTMKTWFRKDVALHALTKKHQETLGMIPGLFDGGEISPKEGLGERASASSKANKGCGCANVMPLISVALLRAVMPQLRSLVHEGTREDREMFRNEMRCEIDLAYAIIAALTSERSREMLLSDGSLADKKGGRWS